MMVFNGRTRSTYFTWTRSGNQHVGLLVSVPPTFLKASNLADQESVWGQRRIRGASIIGRIYDIPVNVVEHVSLAFHWHRFVCFWILYDICRAHHGMAVPGGKYFYWKTTIWLGYILTQWGRYRGQPFSCWALEPLVVKSGENMNILLFFD